MTLLRILTLAVTAGLFCRADDMGDDLLAATRKGDLAQVKALLDKGADVNSKSPYGQTPLFFACDRGYLEIARLLVDKGADVNIEDTFYHASALSWAASKKHNDIVLLLIDHGAKSPQMVLMTGAQTGNMELAKIGLSKPIDAATLSQALLAATKNNHPEVAALLKEHGARPPEPVKTVTLDPAILQGYTGTYTGGRGGTEFEMTFAVKGAALSGAMTGQPALTYAPSDATHFHSVEFEGVNLEFTAGGFKLKQGGQELEFTRKAPKQ
jgi:hypothetical protein